MAKFSQRAVQALGFASFRETCNTLGLLFGGNPNSIKNYRDEFDPLLPNHRQGWHKRPRRDYCLHYFEKYHQLDFATFTQLVLSFIPNYDVEKLLENDPSELNATAKRLATGYAAEAYFKQYYNKEPLFTDFKLYDATNNAVGFDYKLQRHDMTYYVEVKGLNAPSGSILMTAKEYQVAQALTEQYCLFIVSNFREKPRHQLIVDPLHSHLVFAKKRQVITQTNYLASV